MSPKAARTARELQMLESMVDCAHGLGMAFGAAAKAEADTKRCLEFFDAFQKSFLAVRMGIRLCMTLRAPPKAVATPASERAETLEREPAELDAPEREPREGVEREREREYEPVSLPRFLSTLGVVARDAACLGDRLPSDTATRILPTLQSLLAQATADPEPPEPTPSPPGGVAVLARPPRAATRHTLLGSAAAARPGPHATPPWTGSG